MAKPYEIHGIPDNAWLEYDEPPEYAVIYEDNGVDDPFYSPHGLIPGEERLWGKAEYWTPLEAALLMVGVSPDDEQLYAVSREIVPDEGYGASYYNWKYKYEFDRARDYLFLLERCSLAPKAAPIEWVKYFNKKVRRTSSFMEIRDGDNWLEYFAVELNENDQAESAKSITPDNPGRRERQHETILPITTSESTAPLSGDTYSTRWLEIQQATIAQFFNPRRNPDAKRGEVVEWIKQQAEKAGLPDSNNVATTIFTIIKSANHDPRKKRVEPLE